MTENTTPAPFERETQVLEEVCDIGVNVEALTSENTFELVLLKLAGHLADARDREDFHESLSIEATLQDISGAFDEVQADQQRAEAQP